jgi:hypothetical protein
MGPPVQVGELIVELIGDGLSAGLTALEALLEAPELGHDLTATGVAGR